MLSPSLAIFADLKRRARQSMLYSRLGSYLPRVRGVLFDAVHGVDTAGIIRLPHLQIASRNASYGFKYESIDPKLFRDIFTSLPIRHQDYVFVDFGSGKGRALLLASTLPFRRIVGVEFSPDLHRIAVRNIRRFRSFSQRCGAVQSVLSDAVDYPLPDEPVVLFFNNPFAEGVLAPVLETVKRSLEAAPRPAFCIYVHPQAGTLLDRDPAFRPLLCSDWYTIYDARLAAERRAA